MIMKNILFYATITTIFFLVFDKYITENNPLLKSKIEQVVESKFQKLYSPESALSETSSGDNTVVVDRTESNYSQNTNGGSANKLEGNVAVVTVFLTDFNMSHGKEINVLVKVNNAEAWLKTKAAQYGKEVNFVNFNYGLNELASFSTPQGWSKNGNTFSSYTALQIFDDTPTGIIDFAKIKNCEQVIVLFVSNGKGRSYAMDNYLASNQVLDYDLIFAPNNVVNEAQIAHEMLHLFGAVDLYQLDGQSQSKMDMLSQFRKDIMANVSNSLSITEFSAFTAWTVGLTSIKYSYYDVLAAR
jgi:hypothetical protein